MCPGARASRGSANSLHSRVLPHAAERRPARGGPRRPTTRKIGEKREIVPFTLGPAGAWLPWTLPLAQTPGDTKTTHRWPAGPRKGPAPSPAARRQGNARAGPGSCRRGCGYQTRRPYRRNGPFPASGTCRRRPSRRELGGDVVGHGPSEPRAGRRRPSANVPERPPGAGAGAGGAAIPAGAKKEKRDISTEVGEREPARRDGIGAVARSGTRIGAKSRCT